MLEFFNKNLNVNGVDFLFAGRKVVLLKLDFRNSATFHLMFYVLDLILSLKIYKIMIDPRGKGHRGLATFEMTC